MIDVLLCVLFFVFFFCFFFFFQAEDGIRDDLVTGVDVCSSDLGVHGTLPLRATDLRCWDDDLGGRIQSWVNERWQYDPSRPHMTACMYHKNRGGDGKHLHFQVHPRTVKL